MVIKNAKAMNAAINSQEIDLIDCTAGLNNDSIKRGLDDFQQGKVIPHAQVRKRYKKWL